MRWLRSTKLIYVGPSYYWDGRTCPGSIPSAAHLFRYVANQPPKANSASHLSGVGKWAPASAGKAKAGMVHSVRWWMRGVQVKLWDPLRTRATPKRLRGVFTTKHHTNPRLPYLTLPYPELLLVKTENSRTFKALTCACQAPRLSAWNKTLIQDWLQQSKQLTDWHHQNIFLIHCPKFCHTKFQPSEIMTQYRSERYIYATYKQIQRRQRCKRSCAHFLYCEIIAKNIMSLCSSVEA